MMKELEKVIRQHLQQYCCMQPQDVYKLIYQNEFGPGHFIEDEHTSLERLIKEYQGIPVKGKGNPIEPIGNGMCRYYLRGAGEDAIEMLNRIFVLTANRHKGEPESFEEKLSSVIPFLKKLNFEFSEKEYADYIRGQKEQNYPAVSHSEAYREAFHPAYRVIEYRFAPYLKLFTELAKKKKENCRLIVGIDGNASAGKTTLAQCLADLFDCECIHMDDFFLPPALRTKERLGEIGGNIHYERFFDEVVRGVRSGQAFSYRIFSCSELGYVGRKKISNQRMLVVEGAYAMREDFREIYDFRIFMKLSPEEQKNRIMRRNGKEMWQMFREKWIPMENRYFQQLPVEEICDTILEEESIDSVWGEW